VLGVIGLALMVPAALHESADGTFSPSRSATSSALLRKLTFDDR
jgi:hypothetical protein